MDDEMCNKSLLKPSIINYDDSKSGITHKTRKSGRMGRQAQQLINERIQEV